MNRNLHQGVKRAWIELGIFSIIINLFLLVPPIYMMQVYDRVLPSASIPTLTYLSLIAAGSLLFMALMDVIRSTYCQRVALQFDRELGEGAFFSSLMSPRSASGDIQPMRDLASVRSFIASKGLANILDIPFAPLFAILLFFIHPVLFIATLAGAAVMILLVIANQFAARSAAAKAQEASAISNLLAQAFVRNGDTVRGMGMLGHITDAWGKRFAEAALLQDRAASINSVFSGASRTLRMALQLVILGAGAVLVMKGEMTAGMIFAASTISGRALQPIDQLVAGWRQIFDARMAWDRLNASLSETENLRPERLTLPEPKGRLTARELVWMPQQNGPNAVPIIKRVSFDIKAGEAVAILGPSGAGKSTLARLLAGVFRPNAGTIALDGADYQTWDIRQLGGYIGYLAQDVQLLPGTITENIARFDYAASAEDVTDAANRAEAHSLITGLKQGYQTLIEASGTSLSGGTRQRIGLARAFFGAPKLLILDEPNSNLDADGELALEAALLRAKARGTTVIIVTHRPSIVLKCDKAMVLRDGAIESFGPAVETLQRLSKGVRPGMKPGRSPAGIQPMPANADDQRAIALAVASGE
ncbi:type I secretion system permease/ATPase [Rhizobium leguminosarum]|uniref:type I secretion system permease/ATPase n=1 Tax=Rhizobium leguminosarum TaxID=384 RepID=UPI001C97CB98|nr:type I secretion system permease/ATPase [Rhizobium leguminosarum]MBY5746877.1 type I secretion system permease/ATPase [Rhizobium leguminosarum]